MHDDTKEGYKWFHDDVLFNRKDGLILHSDSIGDTVEAVRVIAVIGERK
jgi:hypothetical protein